MPDPLLFSALAAWVFAAGGLAAVAWPRWRGGTPGGTPALASAALTLIVPATLSALYAVEGAVPVAAQEPLLWLVFVTAVGGVWLAAAALVRAWGVRPAGNPGRGDAR